MMSCRRRLLQSQENKEKNTLDDELAIQRQKETKPDEWSEYFAYCEECKAKAKEKINN